jgi:hypothetical protein
VIGENLVVPEDSGGAVMTQSRGTLTRAIACAIALIGAVACQPSGSPGGATGAPGGTTASPAAAPAFLTLIEKTQTAVYRADYRVTGTASGQSLTGTWTVHQKPPNARIDVSMTAAGQPLGFAAYMRGDKLTVCFSGQLSGCLEQAIDPKDLTSGLIDQQLRENPENFDVAYQRDRDIAGNRGHCYRVQAKAGTASDLTDSSFCYSATGVLLFAQAKTADANVEAEATSVSTDVRDADLVPPSR